MTEIHHMTADEKTAAIIVLAEALYAATLVGNPAPIVKRLAAWMTAPPQFGDVVVEMSTKHHGTHRVGTVNDVLDSRSHYDRVVEILVLDAPCGNDACEDLACIHRPRWSNAYFVRVPVTPAQLAEACGVRLAGGVPLASAVG